MSHVAIETNLWDQDEAIELGESLGDPEAWRFLVRLWAWGIDSDRQSGIIRLPAKRLAQICNFNGDRELRTRLKMVARRGHRVSKLAPLGRQVTSPFFSRLTTKITGRADQHE